MLVLNTTLLLVSVNPGFNLLPHANGVHLKKKRLALKKSTKTKADALDVLATDLIKKKGLKHVSKKA